MPLRSQPLYCPPRCSGPGARLDRNQFICACSDWRSCCCFSCRRRCSYWRLQVVVLAGVQPQYCGCQCRGISSCGARDQQDGSRHCSPKVRSNRWVQTLPRQVPSQVNIRPIFCFASGNQAHLACCCLLMRIGADVNAVDEDGRLRLHFADLIFSAFKQHCRFVLHLLPPRLPCPCTRLSFIRFFWASSGITQCAHQCLADSMGGSLWLSWGCKPYFSQPRSTVTPLLNPSYNASSAIALTDSWLTTMLTYSETWCCTADYSRRKARPASMLQHARQTAAGRHQPAAHNPDLTHVLIKYKKITY